MNSAKLLDSFRSLSDDIFIYISELENENTRLTAACQQLEEEIGRKDAEISHLASMLKQQDADNGAITELESTGSELEEIEECISELEKPAATICIGKEMVQKMKDNFYSSHCSTPPGYWDVGFSQ